MIKVYASEIWTTLLMEGCRSTAAIAIVKMTQWSVLIAIHVSIESPSAISS